MYVAGCRKDFRSGPAVIATREARVQFLKIYSMMNIIKLPKSGPAKTGSAGLAPMNVQTKWNCLIPILSGLVKY